MSEFLEFLLSNRAIKCNEEKFQSYGRPAEFSFQSRTFVGRSVSENACFQSPGFKHQTPRADEIPVNYTTVVNYGFWG